MRYPIWGPRWGTPRYADTHHQHLLREFILKWFSIIYVSCFWFYYMMSRSYKHTSFSYKKTTNRYRVQHAAAPICFERDFVKGSIGFCSFHHNGTGGLDFTLVTENTAHIFCSYNSESELTYDGLWSWVVVASARVTNACTNLNNFWI